MKHFNNLLISAVFVGLFSSCGSDKLDIDTSNVNIKPVKIERLDRDLFGINTGNSDTKKKELENKYGNFYRQFIYSIINANQKDSDFVLKFVSDKDMKGAYDDVQSSINDGDIANLESELTECEKRFRVLFPNRKLPKRHIAYFSGFNYNIVYPDSVLGISLEMYLGSDNKYYKMLQWPAYQRRTLRKEYMLPNLIRGWLITEFDNAQPVNNLLNHMIFYGKIFYACDALLPNLNDSLKISYSSQQMEYCLNYEKNLWGFFAQENRLYENNLKTVTEFTSEGPFTGAISKECPPRVAMWLGWQIVRSYMKNNGNVTLSELMADTDAQKILTKSKYRP